MVSRKEIPLSRQQHYIPRSISLTGDFMETAKISSKGQLVIPKHLRDALGFAAGAEIIMVRSDDKIIITRKPDNPVDALVKAGGRVGMRNVRRHIKEE